MIKQILLLFTCLFVNELTAQNTVGLLTHNVDKAYDGYNLFFPHGQTDVFLLDNCGRIVNTWEGETHKPGNSVYLTEDGKLYKCESRGAASNEWIHAGGGGERVQILDWEGNVEWQYTVNDSMQRMHHDIVVKPNGNILMIVWDRFLYTDAVNAGRNLDFLTENEVWSEKIIEVKPNFETGEGEIVWEWRAWDHLVQQYDVNKENFGIVANNPNKINLNYAASDKADWLHMNAIDYNPFYEQIVVSVPTFNEFWIIDQSTNTTQAATGSGGLSGQGGDLLFRYGNPAAYNNGTEEDQVSFYQHDVHWIDLNLVNGDKDFGKIMLYNNRVDGVRSSVDIVSVVFDGYEGGFPMNEDGVFEPTEPEWTYTTPNPDDMYSTGLSSVQKLKNENTLICAGRQGYIFEITPDEEIVWEYKNPIRGGLPVSQGEELALNENLVFRMNRYGSDFLAFDGKDLSPKGYIELNPNTEDDCTLVGTSITEIKEELQISVFPNPFNDLLNINSLSEKGEIEIVNIMGQIVFVSQLNENQEIIIETSDWINGTYLVLFNQQIIDKVILQK